MTSFRIEYSPTSEQKELLRDLLIYIISKYDSQIGRKKYMGRCHSYREMAFEILNQLSNENIIGDDSTIMFVEREIIKLCNPIPDDIRQNYNHHMRTDEEKAGLKGILHLYSNDIIEGLKSSLETNIDNMYMASTSSFCIQQGTSIVLTNMTAQLKLWDEQK